MRKPRKQAPKPEAPFFEARVAKDLRVLATVEGAQFVVDLKQFEPVIAQKRDKGLAAVLFKYGESTAEALISLLLLVLPPGTSLPA